MTKYWGLAGLRLGYAVAAPAGHGAARRGPTLERQRLRPGGRRACARRPRASPPLGRAAHRRARPLVAGLRARGWVTEPTTAGFFLIHVGDAPAARRALLAQGCLVRDCTSFGLPGHVRVSPRHPEQNDRLLEAFAALTPPRAAG